MGEHRVPMLSASLRRYPDPETSADPRVFAVVSALRTLELAPAPRAHFQAELRAQLVAVAPRLVADGATVEIPRISETKALTSVGDTAAASTRASRRRTSFSINGLSLGRPLAIVTTIVAVFALVLGGAVWMSKKALPGDALYSLKRANENVKLSLTDGATAKSKAYLDFAGERVDEVAALLKRSSASAFGAGATASAAVSPHTASLVRSTLDSADSDVQNAAVLLGQQTVSSKSAAPLAILIGWAPSQIQKLQTITGRLPAGVLHDRAAGSTDLVRSAVIRADNLSAMAGCSCLASAASDALGPVPCSPCTTPLPVPPVLPTLPLPGVTPTPSTPAPTGSSSDTGGGSSSAGSSSSGGTGSGNPGVVVPTLPTLPSLPIHLPTLPTLFPPHTKTPTVSPSCVVRLLGICVHL